MTAAEGNASARLLRRLPAIDELKRRHTALAEDLPETLWSDLCREAVQETRAAVLAGAVSAPAELARHLDDSVIARLDLLRGPILRRVINGTGVLIHTNAGRSPLSAAALAALVETSGGYCNLELSLDTGKRGSRQALLRPLLRWLCKAEDALVVNNGAAAIMLALHALAVDRPVIVSRGELVEIGGSFRIPDVMRAAGCRLHEVGTTNRTHLRDYAEAIADLAEAGTPAGALLQVHRSNFELRGFVTQPPLADMAALAHAHDLPLIVDLGSGALQPMAAFGLRDEPTVAEVLAAGADVATFSGDKLVGGPQAGLLVGGARWLGPMARSAMARAVRVDATVLAALEVVLRSHLLGRSTVELPIWQAISLHPSAVEAAAKELAGLLAAALSTDWRFEVVADEARMGGGSQALATVPSFCLTVSHGRRSAEAVERILRAATPAIIGRTRDGKLLLDMRSMLAGCGGCEALQDLACDLIVALSRAGPGADRDRERI